MKFLVDAQLPKRLVLEIIALGGDARHTLDLAAGNKTTDEQIIKLALEDDSVVVTKDSDFVDSLMLRRKPKKLLFITTGNIPNDELIALLRANCTHTCGSACPDAWPGAVHALRHLWCRCCLSASCQPCLQSPILVSGSMCPTQLECCPVLGTLSLQWFVLQESTARHEDNVFQGCGLDCDMWSSHIGIILQQFVFSRAR